jgi:hypothetical protein
MGTKKQKHRPLAPQPGTRSFLVGPGIVSSRPAPRRRSSSTS